MRLGKTTSANARNIVVHARQNLRNCESHEAFPWTQAHLKPTEQDTAIIVLAPVQYNLETQTNQNSETTLKKQYYSHNQGKIKSVRAHKT